MGRLKSSRAKSKINKKKSVLDMPKTSVVKPKRTIERIDIENSGSAKSKASITRPGVGFVAQTKRSFLGGFGGGAGHDKVLSPIFWVGAPEP